MGHVVGRVMDIITPLIYCGLRGADGAECDTFASRRVEGLACCQRCAERLQTALESEGVVLVKEVFRGDKRLEIRGSG